MRDQSAGEYRPVTVLIVVLPGDDNPGLVGIFSGGGRRIDRHYNAAQDRHMLSPALVQLLAVPQRARDVLEYLGVQLLLGPKDRK